MCSCICICIYLCDLLDVSGLALPQELIPAVAHAPRLGRARPRRLHHVVDPLVLCLHAAEQKENTLRPFTFSLGLEFLICTTLARKIGRTASIPFSRPPPAGGFIIPSIHVCFVCRRAIFFICRYGTGQDVALQTHPRRRFTNGLCRCRATWNTHRKPGPDSGPGSAVFR